MKKHQCFKTAAFRFRRFCRKAYAAFNSMHRVVNIGRLASYVADHQVVKTGVATMCLWLMPLTMIEAQTDDDGNITTLPQLDIISSALPTAQSADAVAVVSHEQIQHLVVASVGDLLEQLPGVALRTRGAGDVQSDITMHGGTYDQMLVLINGINISDIQTGHHNMDIPIDISMVQRIELIPPAALLHYGLNALCGAINIVVGEQDLAKLRAQIEVGSFGQIHGALGMSGTHHGWDLSASASYHHSYGYRDNTDYTHGNLMLTAQRQLDNGFIKLMAGAQMKDFGSMDFYSTAYPYQFEATRTAMAAAIRQFTIARWQMELSASTRWHSDRFELFRTGMVEAPSWYKDHNYHLTSHTGMRVRAMRNWSLGNSTIGADVSHQQIFSTVLGDTLSRPVNIPFTPDKQYSLGKNRETLSLFAEHSYPLPWALLSATVMATGNTMAGNNYSYAFSASRKPSDHLDLAASFSRAIRPPTFTELYYQSVNHIADPALKHETSHQLQLSARYHYKATSSSLLLYARRGDNIIDWIRKPESAVWHSTNHNRIDAVGADLQYAVSISRFIPKLAATYSFCTLSQQPTDFISSYALDYLRHQATIDIVIKPMKQLQLKLQSSYRRHIGSYTDADGNMLNYPDVWLTNAAVEYQIKRLTLFADCINMFNHSYMDYGGIPQPGRSILIGIRLNS